MSRHVVSEIGFPGKSFATNMATKLLFPLTIGTQDVGSFVTCKIGLVTETLPTFVTSERLLSSVCPHVGQHVALAVKLLLTKHAGEVSLIGVRLSVGVEGTFGGKGCRAEVTKMRTDAKMNCINVELETRGVLALVITIFTLKVAFRICLVGVA